MKTKKTGKINSYLLDTSAVLCLWLDESGSNVEENILRKKKDNVFVSFMTFMEGRYILRKGEGKATAEEFYRYLDLLPIKRIDINDSILNNAVEIKASSRLSVADSFIIATAMDNNATLVHKDPEFEQVEDKVELLTLPYKPKKSKPR